MVLDFLLIIKVEFCLMSHNWLMAEIMTKMYALVMFVKYKYFIKIFFRSILLYDI